MKIDLEMKNGEMSPIRMDEKNYPSFHYEGDENLELPKEGTMTVHYCKTASSVSERNGVMHYSCTVEVKHILSVKETDYEDEAPTKKSSRGAEEALDKLMSEVVGRKSKSEAY